MAQTIVKLGERNLVELSAAFDNMNPSFVPCPKEQRNQRRRILILAKVHPRVACQLSSLLI